PWHGAQVWVFFSSRRRHTRSKRDWSSDVCSSDLPIIEVGKDLGLAYIHRAWVVDLVRQGVLLGEAAPVVGLIVVPVALHAPVTDPADETSFEDVRARRASRRMLCGPTSTTGQDLLCLVEGVL